MNEKWRTELVAKYGEYLGRRSYYGIKDDGTINRKTINSGMIAAAFGKNREETEKFIENNCIWKNEKKKIRAVERMSRFSIEELVKNFSKTILKGEEVFAVKFGYELYLREFELFKKIVLYFATANCGDELLPLYSVAALKLIEIDREDGYLPVYLLIEMLTMYPKNLTIYEMVKSKRELQVKSSKLKNCSYGIKGRERAIELLRDAGFENIEAVEKASKIIEELSFENGINGVELEL